MGDLIHRSWLILKHRPFFRCPFCEGKGGAMSGYYEPEWSECYECYRSWEPLVDCGVDWFEGRLALLDWIRAKAAQRCGIWQICGLRQLLACKLGWHRWMNEDAIQPGLRICCICYRDKIEPPTTR